MEKKERKVRVLLGKPGLCGHDRGVLVLAMALRDAGMEVIYSGRHNSPEQIVEASIQEDVDVLGVSILSGAHLSICQRIGDLLRKRKADDICFVAGGFIPDEDVPELKEMGVKEVFGVTSSIDKIIEYFQQASKSRKGTDR